MFLPATFVRNICLRPHRYTSLFSTPPLITSEIFGVTDLCASIFLYKNNILENMIYRKYDLSKQMWRKSGRTSIFPFLYICFNSVLFSEHIFNNSRQANSCFAALFFLIYYVLISTRTKWYGNFLQNGSKDQYVIRRIYLRQIQFQIPPSVGARFVHHWVILQNMH